MVKEAKRKGNKGKPQTVTCDSCGARIPRNKAIRIRKHSLPIDRRLFDELKRRKASLHIGSVIVTYCISCARHRHVI